MKETIVNPLFGNNLSQVAWVVSDIETTAKYFNEILGVPHFFKMKNLKSNELEGSYMGKPAEFEFHLYLALSGETMVELIQPVSGRSIYADFLKTQPIGGVQHVAYSVPEADYEAAVSQITKKGIREIQRLVLPVAKTAYFDTYDSIGVATEIIGVTEAGNRFLEQLRRGEY